MDHVSFVESVEPNGDWNISEMNVIGFDEVDYKEMSPSTVFQFSFINEN
jgi:surface antigen